MASRRLEVFDRTRTPPGLSLCFILVLTTTGGCSNAFAQISRTGARISALVAGVSIRDAAAYLNPASAGMTSETVVALWVAQLYGLPELKVYGGSAASSIGRFGYSVTLGASAFDSFAEEQLSLQISTAIGNKARPSPRIGAGIVFVRKSAAQAGDSIDLVIRNGFLIPISGSLVLGARFQRAVSTNTLSQTGHYESYLVGAGYAFKKDLIIYSDILKDRYFPLSYRFGFESRLAESLTVRMGYSTFPVRFAIGFSVHSRSLFVHFSFDRHSVLGWSMAAEVAFRITSS